MGTDGMDRNRRRYVSYLLRLWQTERGGALVWRASIESARTGERRGFASLSELYAFLAQETAEDDEDESRTPAGENADV